MIDETWLAQRVTESQQATKEPAHSLERLRGLLERCAVGFAEVRPDVQSAAIAWPRRGLRSDEATSFLRAIDGGLAEVDDAGFVTMRCVRAKTPAGRYALFSRSGAGVSVNLEYLIQIGTTAELVLDHGWPAEQIDFERGEFDALGRGEDDRVVLAVEAKARVTGPDSLEKLVHAWIGFGAGAPVPRDNAGRKYLELRRLCEAGSVTVWLVAADARWTMVARATEALMRLDAGGCVTYVEGGLAMAAREVISTQPHDKSLHRRGTKGADGLCSWFCDGPAAYSTLVRESNGTKSLFALCEDHQRRVESVYSS